MPAFKFENGEYVKDMITGYEGVVTGRTDYITGCNQILVNPQKINDDGKTVDGQWFDEHRLTLTGRERLVIPTAAESAAQGAMESAPVK